MTNITDEYLKSVAPIYKDVLGAFQVFNPARREGEGFAFQTLYSVLSDKYSLGQIQAACQELEKGGAVEIKNKIFAHPTSLGEDLIEAVTGSKPQPLPPFLPPTPVN
jgi:hypothetical protein